MVKNSTPIVSVAMITYNHAPYIGRAIESVLMQKTTFPFEIVIGEDCSTDGANEIVLDYAKQYPETIRVITSDTNVGMMENDKRTNFACRGEYIAFCEGDDYWIDPLKLQKQYQTLTQYDALSVTHNSFVLTLQDGILVGAKPRMAGGDSGFVNPEDIILKKNNPHASSLFIKISILQQMPEWYYQSPSGDVPFRMIAANMGRMYYINEIMSVYQHGTAGSWTDRERKIDKNDPQHLKFIRNYLEMCKNFDNFSGQKYHQAVQKRSQDFLIKHIFERGYKEYLDIPENQKKKIDLIVFLSKYVPARLKNKIQRMVATYLIDSIYE